MRWDTGAAIFGLTVASAAAVLLSIAAAQILLTAAYLLWLYQLYKQPTPIRWPSYFVPLAAFMVTTLAALAASPNPGIGWHPVQKFVLFPMGLLAANFVTSDSRARTAYRFLLSAGALAAIAGIIQFAIKYLNFVQTSLQVDDPTLVNRITGPLGHWMTFSGVQLLVWCAGIPALVVLARRWLAPVSLMGIALILSYTRGVWLGAGAGIAAVAMAIPKRVLVAVLLPLLGAGAITSPLIIRRLTTSLDTGLATNYSRREYLNVGARMIQDHPLFGVGPERVYEEFPRYYRGIALDTFYYGHLHSNILQIAAERGLLALAAFLWFLLELYRSLIGLLKTHTETRWATLGALAALTGFVVAGLNEYNFGDSEVLLLLLFIVSLPFGLAGHVQENPDRQ